MPFKGVDCPDPDNGIVSSDFCFNCSLTEKNRVCPCPPWLIKATVFNVDDSSLSHRWGPNYMLSCHRMQAIKNEYPYTLYPGNMWAMTRGTAIHQFAEAQNTGLMAELTREREIKLDNGVTIPVKGTIDEYNPETKHLADTKSVVYIGKELKENPKFEWNAQLSVYRWLLHPDYPVESAEIYLLDGKTLFRKPIRLWSLERTEDFIRERGLSLWKVYNEGYYPGVLKVDDQWRCSFCEVRDICNDLCEVDGDIPPDPEARKAEKQAWKKGKK